MVTQDGKDIRQLLPGEHFGEGALIEAYNLRTATCRAITEVTCVILDREVVPFG